MRIVGGIHSSRRLTAPDGKETRPTLDKIREAVFSSLGGFFDGGVVLDLYAGSGAVGLEAVSRGCDHAVFADPSRKAIACIKENIHALHEEEKCETYQMSDMAVLKMMATEGRKFNLVYLDPPYAKAHHDDVLTFLVEHDLLAPGAKVVIESLKEEVYTKDYPSLHPYKDKVYGITRITYYQAD